MSPEKKKQWRKRALERKLRMSQKRQDFLKAWQAMVSRWDREAGIKT